MVRCVVVGCGGRMGRQVLAETARRDTVCCVAGVDRRGADDLRGIPVFPALEDYRRSGIEADVLIDFSSPQAAPEVCRFCEQTRMPCVICTTGHNAAQQEMIRRLSHKTAVFQSANLSLGIAVLARLARQAATLLGPEFDVEIIEKHHRDKKDSPSGTALMLAKEVLPQDAAISGHTSGASPAAPPIHSVRAGGIVGDHEILFAGRQEVLTISHHAQSRALFAEGALAAAGFIVQKTAGMYQMKDLIS